MIGENKIKAMRDPDISIVRLVREYVLRKKPISMVKRPLLNKANVFGSGTVALSFTGVAQAELKQNMTRNTENNTVIFLIFFNITSLLK